MGCQCHQLDHMHVFAYLSRQITTPAPHRSIFYGPGALPATQLTVSNYSVMHRWQEKLYGQNDSLGHSMDLIWSACTDSPLSSKGQSLMSAVALLCIHLLWSCGCRQLKIRIPPCQTCCVCVAESTKTSSLNQITRTRHHCSMLSTGEIPH